MFKGSKNHWENFIELYLSFKDKKLSSSNRSTCPNNIKSGLKFSMVLTIVLNKYFFPPISKIFLV